MPIVRCKIDESTKIWHPNLVNLYECTIGKNCNVGAFVEIGRGVVIGDNVRIQARAFIPENVVVEDDVFIGPGVTFTNDPAPHVRNNGWSGLPPTTIKNGATICANVTILPNVTIGEDAMCAAGSVVTKNIPAGEIWAGNPARPMMRVPKLIPKPLDQQLGSLGATE